MKKGSSTGCREMCMKKDFDGLDVLNSRKYESTQKFNGNRGSKFTQQELPAWKPILTPTWIISSLLFISAVLFSIGFLSLTASNKVVEIVQRYDHECIPNEWKSHQVAYIKSDIDKTCNITLKVPKFMKQPIYVYYQLDNFYQNHPRYAKSRSDEQLRGIQTSDKNLNVCRPGKEANGKIIIPCGLIAWSLFNDTYSFSVIKNNTPFENLTVNMKGISWKSDRDHKFSKNVKPKNFQKSNFVGGKSLDENKPLNEQEDLIVWMKTAAFPNFRKLYGKIEKDLNKNDMLRVVVMNNYNVYSFNGKKRLVLSTTTWIGGKNPFLGVAYLVVGGLCLVLGLAFFILYSMKPRPLGDPACLSWNRNSKVH